MEKKFRKQKGITLIALVITIVVLLILAGVTISIITGNNSIMGKAQTAVEENKRAQYYEEINMEIVNEKLERGLEKKKKAFIESINERLIGSSVASTQEVATRTRKNWVKETKMCDENLETKENPYDNEILIVTTKEDYEIYVEIDNVQESAKIKEGSYIKTENVNCTLTYDPNGATGSTQTQAVKKGFKAKLIENPYTRVGFEFAGWSKANDGSQETHSSGEKIQIDGDTTIYAMWTQVSYSITYNANGGEGAPSAQTKMMGTDIALSGTIPTRSGYQFLGWATSSTVTEAQYTPEQVYSVDANLYLYAVWRQGYVISYNANGGTDAPESQFKLPGTALTLSDVTSETVPKKANSLFIGWSESSSATTADYTPGGTFNTEISSATTLYAVYRSSDFAYTGSSQTVTLYPGTYQLEVWGAQGGNSANYIGGKGGYSYGKIELTSSKKIYIYIGGQGVSTSTNNSTNNGGFNGGGFSVATASAVGASGGGGTDIRISNDSLFSRVIVAGGGGGAGQNSNNGNGFAAGGLSGLGSSIGSSSSISTSNTYNTSGGRTGNTNIRR